MEDDLQQPFLGSPVIKLITWKHLEVMEDDLGVMEDDLGVMENDLS